MSELTRRFAFLGLVCGSLAGCGEASSVEAPLAEAPGTSELPLVAAQTFDRAATIVRGIDYLPFQYKEDGCYARALYMSMELAKEHIESNSLFVFARPDCPLVVGDIEWSYHVAPMLMVPSGSDIIWRVLDPAMGSRPFTADQWLAGMGHKRKETVVVRGTVKDVSPTLIYVPGSRYTPDGIDGEKQLYDTDIPNYESLPSFYASDVTDACSVMHEYIGYEQEEGDIPASEAAPKRARLVEATATLTAALEADGKLDRGNGSTASSAATRIVAACRRAVNGG